MPKRAAKQTVMKSLRLLRLRCGMLTRIVLRRRPPRYAATLVGWTGKSDEQRSPHISTTSPPATPPPPLQPQQTPARCEGGVCDQIDGREGGVASSCSVPLVLLLISFFLSLSSPPLPFFPLLFCAAVLHHTATRAHALYQFGCMGVRGVV